jgi:uncharacterized membrane protein (DUF4010 family)
MESAILWVSAGLHDWLGTQALSSTAALTGLADAHAGARHALCLLSWQKIPPPQAVISVLIVLLVNTVSKALLAIQSGGWPYAARAVPGWLVWVGAACLATLFS